jgi:hypothetical protein
MTTDQSQTAPTPVRIQDLSPAQRSLAIAPFGGNKGVASRDCREFIVAYSAECDLSRAYVRIEAPGAVCRNQGTGNGQFSTPIYSLTDPSASRPKRCISWYFWTNNSRSTLSCPGSREEVSSVDPPKIFAIASSLLLCTAWSYSVRPGKKFDLPPWSPGTSAVRMLEPGPGIPSHLRVSLERQAAQSHRRLRVPRWT